MAVISNSKEIYAPSGSTPWTLQTQFEVTSQNTANNTSTISLSGYLQSSQGSFGGGTDNALVLVWHDNNTNVDNQVAVLYVSSASSGQRFNVSATYTATHKSDGTLSGYSRTVWLKRNNNNYTPDGDYINTSNTALPSIPRASVPTVNPARVTLGDSFTVNTNRSSTSFTHTIRVIAGNTVLKEVTNVGADTTINSSEFATTLLNSDATATSYPLEVRCVTTGVSSDYRACAVTMLTSQERHAPILSNFTVTETSGNSDIPSNTTVTNLSRKHISININPNYSEIRSVVLINGTQNVNLVENSNTATLYEADIVPTDGTYSVKVISSRGYTATDTVAQTKIEYTPPYLEEVTFTRATDTGSTGSLRIKGGYWSGTIGSTTNSLSAQYYSISGGSNVNLGTSSNPFDETYSIQNVLYDRDYRIEVYIMDAFGQTAVVVDFLRSAKPLFWMGRETARCAKHWIFDGDGLNGEIEIYPSANGGIRWGNTIITKAIFDTLPSGGGGGGGITVETDPTVPAWAKQSTKPTYTASEVGALPASTVIPTKTSDLTNDSGYISSYTETDPTVPSWAKAANKPTYTASEVGALPSNTFIPELTSDLTNDSNFVSDANYQHTSISGDNNNPYRIVMTHGNATFYTLEEQYIDNELNYKLDAPTATGTAGQFLQKTASGTQWATISIPAGADELEWTGSSMLGQATKPGTIEDAIMAVFNYINSLDATNTEY